jgi:hypothetical protein
MEAERRCKDGPSCILKARPSRFYLGLAEVMAVGYHTQLLVWKKVVRRQSRVELKPMTSEFFFLV